jgi:hypothetical protein
MNFRIVIWAIKELGLKSVLLNTIYRLGIASGIYRLMTPPASYSDSNNAVHLSAQEPDTANRLLTAAQPDIAENQQIIAAADEITQGIIQLYGAIPTHLQFNQKSTSHWSSYQIGTNESGLVDIKDIWEAARFSWVFVLGQAYHLTHNEKYAAFFWEKADLFLESNPPNLGPHWMNGQEVALRLISFVFAQQVFYNSPHSTTEKTSCLQAALAAHARRITATVIYARSQCNNHILSEAAGLYTAGVFLQGIPEVTRWRQSGWTLFIQGLRDQIAPDGSYIQQSVGYHRFMLQLAIWVKAMTAIECAEDFPEDVNEKIIKAINWLELLTSPSEGHVPNMGSNDGANILPLGGVDVLDYRPVIKLAKSMFKITDGPQLIVNNSTAEQVIVMRDEKQTAYLRAVHFRGRPSQADQLHLDLWWKKWNIALDAGTYRYNHAPPWENALARTIVHNTITIDNSDQMIRAGRFLWLRRAIINHLALRQNRSGRISSASAEQDGYRHLSIIHKRSVESKPNDKPGWLIQDDLLPVGDLPITRMHTIRLAWLLPDWEWELDGNQFHLITPAGTIRIFFSTKNVDEKAVNLEVHRAGTALTSSRNTDPVWGWYSPTYGVKEPALAVHLVAYGQIPMQLTTLWQLPA